MEDAQHGCGARLALICRNIATIVHSFFSFNVITYNLFITMGKKRSRSRSRERSLSLGSASSLSSINKSTGQDDRTNIQTEINKKNEKVKGNTKTTATTPTSLRPNRLERKHVESRLQLPVYKQKAEICSLVAQNEAVLVVAETVSQIMKCL